jgi:hypothetical protein
MKRVLVSVVAVGALSFSVFLIQGGTVQQQLNVLTDAGVVPNRVATCPVRISPELKADALAAGVTVHTYERLSFPVALTILADGGRDVQLPPIRADVRVGIEPDWENCTLVTCAARPAVCAKWGDALPLVLETRSGRCLRKNTEAGFGACFTLDGGDPGEMNVRPAGNYSGSCEPVEALGPSCAIIAGESPETEL